MAWQMTASRPVDGTWCFVVSTNFTPFRWDDDVLGDTKTRHSLQSHEQPVLTWLYFVSDCETNEFYLLVGIGFLLRLPNGVWAIHAIDSGDERVRIQMIAINVFRGSTAE